MLEMDNNRLPLICLRRLQILRINTKNDKHNWLSRVLGIINTVTPELTSRLETLDVDCWKAFKTYFLDKYKKYLFEQDLRKLANANYHQLQIMRPLDGSRATFLNKRVHFQALKVLLQARLANKYYHHFTVDQACYKNNPTQPCPICNTGELDNLEHFINVCPILKPYRDFYLLKDNLNPPTASEILNSNDLQTIRCFFLFTKYCCRLKAFLLCE